MSGSHTQHEENSLPAQERGIDEGILKNPHHRLYSIPVVRDYAIILGSHEGLIGRSKEFDQMILDAKAGIWGYLLVDKIDRLGRNLLESLMVLQDLENAGAHIVSAKEPFDPEEPAGWLGLMIMRIIADWQSRNLAVEVMKGLREKLERGEWVSRLPFGFRFREPRDLPGKGGRVQRLSILIANPPFSSYIGTGFVEFATNRYTLRVS